MRLPRVRLRFRPPSEGCRWRNIMATRKAAPKPADEILGFEEEGEEQSASPGKQAAEKVEDDEEEFDPLLNPDEVPPWAETLLRDAGVTPPKGRVIWYIKCRSTMTHTPERGDRIIALWTISDIEEDMAATRASGKPQSVFLKECAKLMIRAFDGHKALWGGGKHEGNARQLWEDIGPKYRELIVNLYLKTHRISKDEGYDFFTKCIAGAPAMF